MSGSPYALRAEGVRKVFGSNEVLTSASVWAKSGCVTTLLGRNGSGKTTLLRVAAGVLRPDQGVVAVDGVALVPAKLHELATRGVMFLPQGRLLVPSLSVAEHFRAIATTFGGSHVDEAVDAAGVESLMPQRAETLSGGEKARVSLALAMARAPRVLLADEPLVGLAPVDQERLGQLLRLLAAQGVAVVTSGHDTPILLSISDEIIWSAAGTTHHIGSPEAAQKHDQFRREYLGPGYRMS
ncbi:MAG: ABC transporter ATP-binding protein [Gemmatimonadota bacterium]